MGSSSIKPASIHAIKEMLSVAVVALNMLQY